MRITVNKEELPFKEGGPEALAPAGDYRRAAEAYARNSSPDPIEIESVSIANAVAIGKKFIEVVTMDEDQGDIANPEADVWFYVKILYPWRIKDGSQDRDEILTDGDNYYLVRRGLAKSPFVLNEYSQNKIITAIQEFVGV